MNDSRYLMLLRTTHKFLDEGAEHITIQREQALEFLAWAESDHHRLTGDTFQQRVQPWMLSCFGAEVSGNTTERNFRFLEESLELVQACGCTKEEVLKLVDYTYGRPVGERYQEVGGVMLTLAALCLAQNLDMHQAGETELTRVWMDIMKIRKKQQAKRDMMSPLPGAVCFFPDITIIEGKTVVEGASTFITADESLGKLAYESAATLTGCTQPWEEANKAKWIAAAKAICAQLSR